MANEFYISAGLIPNDEGETSTASTFYISAGLVPDDLETTPATFNPAWARNCNNLISGSFANV